jgi:hypothetical protein
MKYRTHSGKRSGVPCRNLTLEYISDMANELANLAQTNGNLSLVRSFRAAAAEAGRLQQKLIPDEVSAPKPKSMRLQ